MPDNEKINDIIQSFFSPIFSQIKKIGLKSSIEKIIPGFYIDDFILKKLKRSLRIVRKIHLGSFLGKINIYYRNNYILLDFIGFIGLFIKQIVIPNKKIIEISEDIFKQIEVIFFKDEKNLINKINEILGKLSKKEAISPSDSKEKNLYDFIIIALFNYYNSTNLEFPDWFDSAFKKLKRTEFAKDFLDLCIEILVKAFDEISKNVHVNYDILFESRILRFFLNKNTSQGKISDILKILNLDLKKIIYNFADNYAGTSFLKGLGEHLSCMIRDLVIGVSKDINHGIYENKFNFTLCVGKNLNSRKFRWFGNKNVDEYLEISEDHNFKNSVIVKAKKENIIISRPTVLNLGTIAKYQVESKTKYSVSLFNLKSNKKYFFKIRRDPKDYKNYFTVNDSDFSNFLIMSDSQGMIKQDYDSFLETFESIFKRFQDLQFFIHLGDFVDDGCNENYWDFLLNSKFWGQVPVFPLVGNHESKFHPTLKYVGIRNSIINHFNVEIPDQERIDKGIYYSFEKNNCIYIFLNTNLHDGLGEKQIKWINKTLSNSKAKWKILFLHKSPYSCGPHGDDLDVEIIRKEVNELCLKYKFDIVFGGHDHVYSRTKPICFGKPTNENIYGNKIVNPSGTIFVTLGPVGVKNYKVCQTVHPIVDVLISSSNPSFANIKISDNLLHVQVCEISKISGFNVIDEFFIEKNYDEYNTPKKIKQCIENYPIIPWVDSFERSNKILDLYNKLKKKDREKVDIFKLNSIIRQNIIFQKIMSGNVSIVFNKNEFLDSLKNSKIKMIIVESDIIKFEDRFGFGRNVKIDRDIIIRGNSKLKFVSFMLRPNVNLYVGGGIIIDNSRKQFSLYPSISSFVLKRNSNLIIQDNVWIEQSCGIGLRNKIVKVKDRSCKIFINSENFKKLPNNFISKKFVDCVFNIFD